MEPEDVTTSLVALTAVVVAVCLSAPRAVAGDSIELFEADASDSETSNHSNPPADEGESVTIDEVGGASKKNNDHAAEVPGRSSPAITLPFQKEGSAMMVPASIHGHDVYFIFDTGATYTSLNPQVADLADVEPPDNAPQRPVQTANGRAVLKFGLLERLRLDGHLHRNVTYGLCGGCPKRTYRGKPVAGLLGLNVLNRYDVEITDGQVEMRRNRAHVDRSDDIQPWIEMRDIRAATTKRDGKTIGVVEFTAANRAPRPVGPLALTIACRQGESDSEAVELSLDAGASEQTTVRMELEDCSNPRVDVTSARW